MNVTVTKRTVAPGVRLGRFSFVWRPRLVLVTLALTAAFGCLAWALVLRGRTGRAA